MRRVRRPEHQGRRRRDILCRGDGLRAPDQWHKNGAGIRTAPPLRARLPQTIRRPPRPPPTTARLSLRPGGRGGEGLYDRERETVGASNKYITPTIADGKVFVGMTNGVAIFGLLP